MIQSRRLFVLLWMGMLAIPAIAQIQPGQTTPLGYGMKFGVNYPTIGASNDTYSGLAGVTLGMFFSKPFANHFAWYIEPSFSSVGFRNASIETRFRNYYLEAGAFCYYYPSQYNTDFAFIGGFRPSYLLSHKSQVFELGTFNDKSLDLNKNKNGQIDVTAMMGVSVSMSPILNLELVYNLGLTNQNTSDEVKGRPSTIELNLRLNAVALKRSLDGQNQSVEEMVRNYHKGVLLVMLITPNEKEIKRLTAANRMADVELLQNEIKIRNTKVIKEFGRNFSFAPVYYFMDTNVYRVISGNLEGVFVNANLEIDPAIKVNTDNYFIASFCEDISEYTKRKHFGLFVYDKQMNQLDKPFNHPNQLASPVFDYVVVNNQENKTRRPSYITVPFDRLVSKLNTRLFRYIGN